MSTSPRGTPASASSATSGWSRAAAVDADQREVRSPVALHDLVCDPHERAAHVVAVEDDLRVRLVQLRAPSWPLGTGLKEPPRVRLAARRDAGPARSAGDGLL